MPSIYLHNYFAKELNSKLKRTKNKKIKDDTYFLLFSQSFDYLFSYNFFSIKPGKDIRNLGHFAHTHNSWSYFKNMVSYIKKNKLYDDENLGYLYGSLSHYALDTTFHPYIHYVSGRFNKKNRKKTKKYMGYHAINEINLDAIYYYKDHKEKYYKYKLYKDVYPKVEFTDKLMKTINYTYSSTFGYANMGSIYNKSYNQCRFIYKHLMYDRFNVKKIMYKCFDFFTPFKNFKSYSYSHHINIPKYELLNTEKNIWRHPVTGDEHNESVDELYKIALNTALNCIEKCNEYFLDKCTLEDLEKNIKNISYSSGIDCEDRAIFTYFKY